MDKPLSLPSTDNKTSSPRPTTPQRIDREAVRMLAIEIGLKQAAAELNLNYDMVRQWSVRGKWKQTPVHTQQIGVKKELALAPVTPAVTCHNPRPGDILLAELERNGRETKLSLSRSARNMARQAEKLPVKEAGNVHQVAKTAALVHGWNQDDTQKTLNVNVLAGGRAVVQVQAPNQEQVSPEAGA